LTRIPPHPSPTPPTRRRLPHPPPFRASPNPLCQSMDVTSSPPRSPFITYLLLYSLFFCPQSASKIYVADKRPFLSPCFTFVKQICQPVPCRRFPSAPLVQPSLRPSPPPPYSTTQLFFRDLGSPQKFPLPRRAILPHFSFTPMFATLFKSQFISRPPPKPAFIPFFRSLTDAFCIYVNAAPL